MAKLGKMKRKIYCYGVLLIFLMGPLATGAFSQISTGGVPRSVTLSVPAEVLHQVEVAAPDLARVTEEDTRNPLPYRFAVNLPVDLDFRTSGTWTVASDGSRIWRLNIEAKGARAITLYFDRFRMPEGGRLFVYNPGRTQMLGAYTSANNSPHNSFATSLIYGERLTVEYNPGNDGATPDMHLSEIAYAYRGVSTPSLKTGFGSAGPCEVNVNCSEGDGVQPQKRGIMRIEVKSGGSTMWCTGSVVNNTRNDATPYVLTADHCGKYSSESDLNKWIFYFNYEAAGCPNPTIEPVSKTMTGAQRKAHADVNGSDFFLVLLNQTIPDDYNVYYHGWSRENVVSPSGVGIHHPQGDIKKISTYTSPISTSSWGGTSKPTHWRVTWAQTLHGHGVTEGGSSGSPILDNEGFLIGTLTGGDSSCDSSSLNLPDYYGKFSYHWDQNGTDSASVLKYWLDPDSTGVTKLSGKMVGLKEESMEEAFSLYPNPSAGMVTLNPMGNRRIMQVKVADPWGKVLLVRSYASGTAQPVTLDLTKLESGLYLIILTDDQGMHVRKIIKL